MSPVATRKGAGSSAPPSRPPKVGMISLGCAKNLVDAEIMLGGAALKGFEVTRLITGVCERIRGGAGLRITHNELMQDATYTPLSKAEVIIPADSKVALQDGVRFCLKNLYGTLTEQREPSR